MRYSGDPPWINGWVRKRIQQRKGIYKREGRSAKWRQRKAVTDWILKKRKDSYMSSQRDVLLTGDGHRNFFKNAKAFRSGEKPAEFDVRELLPEKSDAEVAEALAGHFNAISDKFSPVQALEIPRTSDKRLPVLQPYQVAGRLRAFRKPKSLVCGDIFPCLINACSDIIALPLTNIYNTITRTAVWPLAWKREFVTAIPKTSLPAGFNDLRNISCTMFVSKVYESFVLNWAMEEVKAKTNSTEE